MVAVEVSLHPGAFNCDACQCKNRDAGFVKWSIEDVGDFRICPRGDITPRSDFLLSLYPHYKSGFLAFEGGLLDQPNVYLEAMSIISERVNSRE